MLNNYLQDQTSDDAETKKVSTVRNLIATMVSTADDTESPKAIDSHDNAVLTMPSQDPILINDEQGVYDWNRVFKNYESYRDLVLATVSVFGEALCYAPELQGDEGVVEAAIGQSDRARLYASDKLQELFRNDAR